MINGLDGGYVGLCWDRLTQPSYFFAKRDCLEKMAAMETKDQDVSRRGMVTSGCERPCFAISDTITQQQNWGHGAMVISRSCREETWLWWWWWGWGCVGETVRERHNKVGRHLKEKKKKAPGMRRALSKAQTNCCPFLLQAVFLVCALTALCTAINQSMTAISNPAAWLLATAEFHDSACPQIRCYDWVTASETRPLPGVLLVDSGASVKRTHTEFKAPMNSADTHFHATFFQGPGWKEKVAVPYFMITLRV